MDRRDFLWRSCLGLLGCAGLAGCRRGPVEDAPGANSELPQSPERNAALRFLVLTDIHYRGKRDAPWLSRNIARLREEQKADFALVAGDLTEDGTPAQLKAVRELLSGLGVPVHCVPGNHDRLVSRHAWEDVFGKDSANVWVERNGWVIAGFDSTWGAAIRNIDVRPEVLEWIADHASRTPAGTPVIAFTHMPSIPGNEYGLTDLSPVLKAFGHLSPRQLFCGHIHAEVSAIVQGVPQTTNACFSGWKPNHDGSTAKGVFRATATSTDVEYEFIPAG